MKQDNSSPDLLDIVFENRNKAYGAYPIRRSYGLYIGRATGITLLLIALFYLFTRAIPLMLGREPLAANPFDVVASLMDEIQIDPNQPIPPKVEAMVPPPADRPSDRFVPPSVRRDAEVPVETQQLDVDQLTQSDNEVGKKNQSGDLNTAPTLGQESSEFGGIFEDNTPKQEEETYEVFSLQRPPAFPGGEKELIQYLAKNIRYPELAREANIQGRVILSFVIDKDGQVKDVSIIKDIGGGCGKEAMRVVQNMPRWLPGEANGVKVKVRFTLPVNFKLN